MKKIYGLSNPFHSVLGSAYREGPSLWKHFERHRVGYQEVYVYRMSRIGLLSGNLRRHGGISVA